MGHEVAAAATARGHDLCSIIEPAGVESPAAPVYDRLSAEALAGCDAAIEFSLPEAVAANVNAYCDAGVPAVIGTTGWLDQLEQVRARCLESDIGLVYASNFSIGAHIFFRAARYAASLVNGIEEYDLLIHEMHHRRKVDSPSGTALTLAQLVMDAVPRKTRLHTDKFDRAPKADELHVSSSRVGSVPGTHTLIMDSAADTIEVRHQARSRGGFALGSVLAAEWIIDNPGFHTVDEFVDSLLHGKKGE